jgi:iron complex outermembrane receptor protein
MVWGALSRAVRAPARLDRDLFVPGTAPFLLAGGPDFRAEVSNVLELGYRAQPSSQFFYSVTAFHAVHDHLRSIEPNGAGAFVIGNKMEGNSSGIEAWATYQPTTHWRLSAGAVFLDQNLRFEAGSGDTNLAAAGNDPKRQFLLRSSSDLAHNQEFDVMARYVSPLPNPPVPSYVAVDARYGWRIQKGLEFSVTAQNLFDRRHPEFGSAATRSEIERGVFVKVKWSP